MTIAVKPFTGSPATIVRSGEAGDLPVIAEISARYAENAAFALERDRAEADGWVEEPAASTGR